MSKDKNKGPEFTEEEGRNFSKALNNILHDPDNNYIFEDLGDGPLVDRTLRPYRGQSHTDHGERGKEVVSGLTMRDIGDCIARGFAQAQDPDGKSEDFDWTAVIQNSMCNVEKMMGIFPNLPERKR